MGHSRAQILKLRVEWMCCRGLLQRSQTAVMNRSRMSKINPHPASSILGRRFRPDIFRILKCADSPAGSLFLRFPRQGVVISLVFGVEKAANGHEKI